jgi:tyrosyl-tRNA synthetase
VLLDVYSFLDNVKFPMEQVIQCMHYYKFTVIAAMEAIGIPSSSVRFVQESTYQTNAEFVADQWRLCTLVPQQAVRDAWDRSYNPGLQTLAEEHLGVDIQFGGTDQVGTPLPHFSIDRFLVSNDLSQRGIFAFAERFLPQLGYKRRAHIMSPMLPNLLGGKMSSSHPPNTKIMFLDDPETINKKISEAYKEGSSVIENGVLASLKDILIPTSELRWERLRKRKGMDLSDGQGMVGNQKPFCSGDAPTGSVFTVKVDEKDGREYKHYKSYGEIEQDLTEGKLSPDALKTAVAAAFNSLLDPIRKTYEESEEWKAVDKLAYPEPS